jgi:DNA replication regulator SLD3
VIALLRSATSTTIPGLKREGSDPLSLKNMTKGEPRLLRDETNALSRSSSLTSLDDAKAKKKALVEAELQDAISVLRKPNRELAGKAIVEAAERRASRGISTIRSEQFFLKIVPFLANPRHRIEEADSSSTI